MKKIIFTLLFCFISFSAWSQLVVSKEFSEIREEMKNNGISSEEMFQRAIIGYFVSYINIVENNYSDAKYATFENLTYSEQNNNLDIYGGGIIAITQENGGIAVILTTNNGYFKIAYFKNNGRNRYLVGSTEYIEMKRRWGM